MALGAELPQVGRGFFRRAKRNQVAQPLVDGEQSHAVSVGLGVMRAVQLLVAETTDQEMAVIDERVFDAGGGEIGGELRLPHTLSEPQSGRLDAEAALQVVAHPPDLLQPVGAGQRGENRLIESGE